MATIGRFSGRAPWLSMAAFGITGCLTALCHGSAAGAKSSSTSKQQVANYYSSSASAADSSSKRSSASSSSGRKSVTSRQTATRASSSVGRSSAKGKSSSKYVKSSELNYYSQPAHSTMVPAHGQQRYEAGAVSASSGNGVYSSSHAQGSAPVYYSSQTPIVSTSAVGQLQHAPPQEQKRGFFGRALQKSTSAVKSVGTAIRPSRYTGTTQTGKASWYGGRFHGGKTANGERYDMNSMTAAHRTLPFGTLVKVKNLINGRECVVRINNRGPFIKGRIIDMSKAAANELGFMGRGIVKVQMQVLGMGE